MIKIVAKIKVDGYRCERCGHIWVNRELNNKIEPIICPRCKNPRWNEIRDKKK
jgi:DNA-directed RNA polymerase subunit RPC12/RpoP